MGKPKKKQQDDYWDQEFENDLEQNQKVQEEPQAASNVPAEEEEEGLMAMMKKQKQKKQKQPPKKEEEEEANEGNGEIRIKSKKEKEKERKERQKQQQKQKQQQHQKHEEPEKEEEVKAEPEPVAEPQSKSKSAPAAGKKKKNVAALREFLLEKQKREEEEERLRKEQEEEEKRRQEEIARKEAEEREKKELKKQKEKERKERLKKEGKLLTEAERKKKQIDQLKIQQLLEQQNIVHPAKQEESKPKKVVYHHKKKKKDGKQEEKKKEEEENNKQLEQQETVEENWEDLADSWEELDGDQKVEKTAQQLESSSLEEKEDWEHEEEEENEKEENDDDEEDDDDQNEKEEVGSPKDKKSKKENSQENLRSPICCILGHVDTGKTKLLDKIRQTNVQEGEAGGITQQIGATYFPTEAIQTKTQEIIKSQIYAKIPAKTGFHSNFNINIPGLLIIDTPGHESFTNLRSRGSSLCNIAILVVDIMHGLEPQTIESINLLKRGKTPFIVALNKIDRLFGWEKKDNAPFLETFQNQSKAVKKEFQERFEHVKVLFAEQSLNATLFFENPNPKKFLSLVPTSAHTGEGIPDLLSLLVQLTQDRMSNQLKFLSKLEATVLEVKVIEGLGHTIDVILVNGVLKEGDQIVVCGLNGPIVTQIRALLTPQPLRELRVKSAYVHHKEIKASMGVKIAAPDLEKAIAGSRLFVVEEDSDIEHLKEEVMSDLTDLFESLDPNGRGCYVQASTLGSLEALLSFLKDSKIPVSAINIGPVHKKDIIRASVQLEHNKEFATLLAFDVKIDKDAEELAQEMGVTIFRADIIYHLFDQFTKYHQQIQEEKKKQLAPLAVWPCYLKIVPGCVFNKRDPIVVGVDVTEGNLRMGTPICVGSTGLVLGRVAGLEVNHKQVEVAKKGQQVAMKLESTSDQPKIYGRHWSENDFLVSHLTRQSIDVLKESFREEVSREEWLLIKKLKPILHID